MYIYQTDGAGHCSWSGIPGSKLVRIFPAGRAAHRHWECMEQKERLGCCKIGFYLLFFLNDAENGDSTWHAQPVQDRARRHGHAIRLGAALRAAAWRRLYALSSVGGVARTSATLATTHRATLSPCPCRSWGTLSGQSQSRRPMPRHRSPSSRTGPQRRGRSACPPGAVAAGNRGRSPARR